MHDIKALMIGIASVVIEHTNELRKEFAEARAADAAAFAALNEEKDAQMAGLVSALNEKASKGDLLQDRNDQGALVAAQFDKAVALFASMKPADGKDATDEQVSAAAEPVLRSIERDLVKKMDSWIDEIKLPENGATPSEEDVGRAVERVAAKWQLEFERRASDKYDKFMAALPKAKDGIDGLGFDDVKVEYDNERALDIVFERDGAERRFTMKLPLPIYREVFKPGTNYEHHDQVTYAGSTWHALKATDARPGEGNEDWRLVVKRGRDGKDFERGLVVGKGGK